MPSCVVIVSEEITSDAFPLNLPCMRDEAVFLMKSFVFIVVSIFTVTDPSAAWAVWMPGVILNP